MPGIALGAAGGTAEGLNRLVDSPPERCRRLRIDSGRQRGDQFARVTRKRLADDDLLAKRTNPRGVAPPQMLDELGCAAAEEWQVALHAPRNVEQDDQPDVARLIDEERDRLRLSFVANLKVLLSQRRGEPTVPVGDGHIRPNEFAPAAKDGLVLWLFLVLGGCGSDKAGGDEDGDESPYHGAPQRPPEGGHYERLPPEGGSYAG